jgi:hypothetical protein
MGRFSFWLGVTGLILGGIFGAIDLEFLGAVVGGAVGGFAGALVGEGLDLLISPLFGTREDNRVGRWILRILGLVFLVVFCHELYWMVNFVSLAATHNIGARLTQMVGRDSPEAVRDTLKEKRWQVAVYVARPLRWLVRDDIHSSARTAEDLIDNVAAERRKVDSTLHTRGEGIAAEAKGLLDKYIPQTWLLHYLPKDVLIPKEG